MGIALKVWPMTTLGIAIQNRRGRCYPFSGDGNRDIESRSKHYFLGQDVDYSVWVEAKYTRSFTRSLGKERLDPTLVSALIEPNVGAVLFISNGRFNAAYCPTSGLVRQI